ncbi:universal stress protein [Poseidonocella sp. HB161398]|uniref:universal stress protein n=1 Tax=Poseidonocella sp. HB161398 TaxID=2320855 RepID=UPI001108EA61|nr:universal stress protein [Poseidonocella sp. HB161398]
MFKTVLASVDVSVPEETRALLKAAQEAAAGWGATLHVVTVVPDVGMAIVGAQLGQDFGERSRHAAQAELERALADAGVEAEPHVLTGTVYDRVIRLADELDVDLIMVGAHRPELKEYLLGTNAARLLRHSRKSVLVLRGN